MSYCVKKIVSCHFESIQVRFWGAAAVFFMLYIPHWWVLPQSHTKKFFIIFKDLQLQGEIWQEGTGNQWRRMEPTSRGGVCAIFNHHTEEKKTDLCLCYTLSPAESKRIYWEHMSSFLHLLQVFKSHCLTQRPCKWLYHWLCSQLSTFSWLLCCQDSS